MTRLARRLAPLMLGLATLAGAASNPGDEPENLRQLRAMPRERRVALSENLERFDKLAPAEQAAIRKLDAAIARKDLVEQAQYRSLLRRYHLWVNSLTEEEQAQLKAAEGTESRFNLARQFRMKEIEGGSAGLKVSGIRTGDFGVNGPFEVAHLLRIWKVMTAQQRIEVGRLRDRGALFQEIKNQHNAVGVPIQSFPAAEEKYYDAILEGDEAFKKMLGPYSRRAEAVPKKAAAKGKGAARPFDLRFAEFLYFEKHKPKVVSQANLERFSAGCPDWLHEMLDPLSPDDARAYLTILYRLLYPEPGEMPAEAKPAKSAGSPKPSSPRPGSGRSGTAAPF